MMDKKTGKRSFKGAMRIGMVMLVVVGTGVVWGQGSGTGTAANRSVKQPDPYSYLTNFQNDNLKTVEVSVCCNDAQ